MDRDREVRIVELAVSQGRISEVEAARATTVSEASDRSLLSVLIENGALDDSTIRSLLAQFDAAQDPALGEDRHPPVADWDRYRIVGYLGGGGMGSVFKAFDPRLDRHVAIKFIRRGDPSLVRRFKEEARAQARVEHDRICKVYEVGEVEAHPFIVMQLIDGRPLQRVAREMTLDEKVFAVKEVAEGLHEAHRCGLVHRDIKPANIMVSSDTAGARKPFLMDFGLARASESPGITQSGSLVGTPHYMSPEQAAGGSQIDRRSDVYSLGATLYAVLAGRTPFPETDLATVLRRVKEDLPLPLDASIPRDLDAVTMKCLRKDPAERYPSARALAEDLGRYLDGEPVEARPTGALYRLKLRVAKHRVAAAVAGTAVVLLVISAAWGAHTWWSSARRVRLAQQLGQQVERIETIARLAYALPLHDIRPERERIRGEMDEIRDRVESVGGVAVGPGNYALGRGHRALGDHEAARRDLEAAWNAGYRDAAVADALGRTLGALYSAALRQAGMLTDVEQRAAVVAEIERTYRDPALVYLRQSGESEGRTSDYVEGLLAFCEKRHDEALSKAGAAFAAAPWMYEAKLLEGNVHVALAERARQAGSYDDALGEYRQGESAYLAAAEVGRSDPAVHTALCALDATVMRFELQDHGGDVEPAFESGLGACDRALEADPEFADAQAFKSSLFHRRAEHLRASGGDPRELLSLAVESSRRAVQIRPDHAAAHEQIGAALLQMADFGQERGEDPRPQLAEAAREFEAAIALRPADSTYNNLGIVYKNLAMYEMKHGEDPRETLARSVAAYRESLAIKPDQLGPNLNLGTAYSKLAEYEISRGEDPRTSLLEAARAYEAAGAVNPGHMAMHYNVGRVYSDLAYYEGQRGSDPDPLLRNAVDAFGRAIELCGESPYLTHFLTALGGALHQMAVSEMRTGRDPTATLARARGAYGRALEANPDNVHARFSLAVALATQAEYELESNDDPGESVDLALEAAGKTIALDPDRFDAYDIMGHAREIRGRYLVDRGLDPGADTAEAVRALETSARLNPAGAFAPLSLARLSILDGRARMAGGRDPATSFERALEYLLRATRDSPAFSTCRADLYRWWAAWRASRGESPLREIDLGLANAGKALEANPLQAEAMALQGVLLLARASADPDGASDLARRGEDALTRALELNSNLERRFRPYVARVAETKVMD